MGKIMILFKDPYRFLRGIYHRCAFLIPNDKLYLALNYYWSFHRFPNMKSPQTYNEKLQWLKLNYKNPKLGKLVDKNLVKEYVANKIGHEHIIPTLGIYKRPEDIQWDLLPDQFVLKTTHGGGNEGVVICKDKNTINKKEVLKKLNKSLRQDLYVTSREWPYKYVEKKIIAEKYIEDKYGELRDYKFFCFNGEVRALFVATERQKREEPFFNFFDAEYNPLPIKQGHPVNPNLPEKPYMFKEMKRIASALSEGFPHVRVDLYEVHDTVYFGELTFFHFGGVVPFEPSEWDERFGDWLSLPTSY